MKELQDLIRKQLELQTEVMRNGDPRTLVGEELANFILWNVFALEDELHESTQEFQWKPWVTDGSRGTMKDREAFVGELVDAFHFFMNLLLAASPHGTPDDIAAEFISMYLAKWETNRRRQLEGYDATKDSNGRELDKVDETALHFMRRSAAEAAERRAIENRRLREHHA